MHFRRLYTILIFILSVLPIAAQRESLYGRVVDKAEGNALEKATLQLYKLTTKRQSQDTTFVSGVFTDGNGRFTFSSVSAGSYLLKATYLGYQTYTKNLTKERGQALAVGDIRLEADAVQLDEAIVTANVPKMVVKDDTVIYNADAFSVPEGSVIEALVEMLPGAKVDDNGGISINGRASDAVTIPINQARRAYNLGNTVHLLCFTAKEGITMSDVTPRVREIISRQHYIDPTDEQAMFLLNTQLIFGIVDNLFKGINFLIWLIGLGTLLAGVIGVSNIMMVSVKERTTEIGIRRAIGATPRQILGQIISESIVLTLVAGMIGIVFSVLILSGVELAMTTDGVLKAAFQVPFGTAVLAALLLTVLGVLAGLMPALRAMQIKPVDAMRDE